MTTISVHTRRSDRHGSRETGLLIGYAALVSFQPGYCGGLLLVRSRALPFCLDNHNSPLQRVNDMLELRSTA
ncbi:hypothetical protein BDW74DRAFT_158523 [Aspergillus multicolor]|uniref:uncharacterized protein n=1 Tax=Aspergillus multicolor TaxID=41759 RepID=UPI003CCD55E8